MGLPGMYHSTMPIMPTKVVQKAELRRQTLGAQMVKKKTQVSAVVMDRPAIIVLTIPAALKANHRVTRPTATTVTRLITTALASATPGLMKRL